MGPNLKTHQIWTTSKLEFRFFSFFFLNYFFINFFNKKYLTIKQILINVRKMTCLFQKIIYFKKKLFWCHCNLGCFLISVQIIITECFGAFKNNDYQTEPFY